jgi:hypothetical protein
MHAWPFEDGRQFVFPANCYDEVILVLGKRLSYTHSIIDRHKPARRRSSAALTRRRRLGGRVIPDVMHARARTAAAAAARSPGGRIYHGLCAVSRRSGYTARLCHLSNGSAYCCPRRRCRLFSSLSNLSAAEALTARLLAHPVVRPSIGLTVDVAKTELGRLFFDKSLLLASRRPSRSHVT